MRTAAWTLPIAWSVAKLLVMAAHVTPTLAPVYRCMAMCTGPLFWRLFARSRPRVFTNPHQNRLHIGVLQEPVLNNRAMHGIYSSLSVILGAKREHLAASGEENA